MITDCIATHFSKRLRAPSPDIHDFKNLHRRGPGCGQRPRHRRHHRLLETRTRGSPPLRQSGNRPARRLVLEPHRPLSRDPRRPAPRRRTSRRLDRFHRHRHLGLRPRTDRPGRRLAGSAAPIPRPALRGHGRSDARADARRGNLRPHRHQNEFLQQLAAPAGGGAQAQSRADGRRSGCCSSRTCSPTGSPDARRSNARSPPPRNCWIRAAATGHGR